ncbi:hypothetical protein R6Q57_005522 [Mikania cordata]
MTFALDMSRRAVLITTGRLGGRPVFGLVWSRRAVLGYQAVFVLVWQRRAVLNKTGRLGIPGCFCPGLAKTDRLDQDGLLTTMDTEMAHDDVGQQRPPMDPDTLALSQHEWLQFEPGSAAAMRCRRIIRMSMGTPRCIDWGVLGDCGEAERARAILDEDTPWIRLFDLVELPSYRLITVEFRSTFRYRAHQATVRVDEDAELPPDIEFSLCGQHFEMSIERFAIHLGIYYEPETVTDGFAQGLTQGEEGVMRAWWAQISYTPFTGHRVPATMIRDSLIRYIHRQAVQPGTVFRLVVRLLLPPSGAWYTVGWLLHHPHCPDQRHG